MAERYVKNALVRWQQDGRREYGFQGQLVDLPSDVEKRLDENGELHPKGWSPDAPGAAPDGDTPAPAEAPDPGTAEQAELVAWLTSGPPKPKPSDVVALADGDADYAEVLLDAEKAAHDGEGRKTVVEPLQAIIDEAGN